MKAIGYIRVSTEEQSADDKYGIEVQKQAISDYANRNDFEIVCWLTDTISGAKDNRPELDKILYNADQLPAHEAVIVFKNDRVARDTKLYFYYFYTLEKRNVKLLSTEEHFSEGDDFANIYRSLLMFVAEQERKNIALRTGRGRSLKAQCGGYSGGNKPYGYYCVDGMLMQNPEERPIVETVFREHDENHTSLLDICEILYDGGYRTRKGKRFQPSTIRGILSNRPFYEASTNMEIWAGYRAYTPRFSHWRCRNEENAIYYACRNTYAGGLRVWS